MEPVSDLHHVDFVARADELRLLKDGWLNGKGKALSDLGLQWFTELFAAHFPADLPQPYLYPTPEGGLRAEWTIHPWELSLEVDLAHHIGAWHSFHLDNDEEQFQTLRLDRGADWDWLIGELRRLVEVAA